MPASGRLWRACAMALRASTHAVAAYLGVVVLSCLAPTPASAQTENSLSVATVNCGGGGCTRGASGTISLLDLGLQGPRPVRIVRAALGEQDGGSAPTPAIVGDLCVAYSWGSVGSNLVLTVDVENSNAQDTSLGESTLEISIVGGMGGSNPNSGNCATPRSAPPVIASVRAISFAPGPSAGTAIATLQATVSDPDVYDQRAGRLQYSWFRVDTAGSSLGVATTITVPVTRGQTYTAGTFIEFLATDSVSPDFAAVGTNTSRRNVETFTVPLDTAPVITSANGPVNSPAANTLFALSGSATDDSGLARMQWFGSSQQGSLGTQIGDQPVSGTTASFNLQHQEAAAGTYYYTLRAIDSSGQPTDSPQFPLAVGGGNQPPVALLEIVPNPAQFEPGSNEVSLTLDASGSSDDGLPGPLTYAFFEVEGGSETPIDASTCSGAVDVCQVSRPATPGTRTFRVRVSDGTFASQADSQVAMGETARNLTVAATSGPSQPAALEGADALVDFDSTVTLDGTPLSPGQQVTYQWTVENVSPIRQLGSTANLADVPLRSGQTYVVRLTVTVGSLVQVAQVEVTVGIAAAAPRDLAQIANLTPTQRSMGGLVDRTCVRLQELNAPDSAVRLSPAQQDLLNRCAALKNSDTSESAAVAGLVAMDGQELASIATQSRHFSTAQIGNLASRLAALRQGARGFNVSALNLQGPGGEPIPLQELAGLIRALGGGASADPDATRDGGELLGDRLGIFINGSVGWGSKDATQNEDGFDFDSSAITIGADYRITDRLVLGAAAGYGQSQSEFDADAGRLDSDTYGLSIYGAAYGKHLHVDFLAGYGSVGFDSRRHLSYVEFPGTVNERAVEQVAVSQPDGDQLWVGLSGGWDFNRAGWILSPELAVAYSRANIKPFAESIDSQSGGFGLALAFDEQDIESLTVRGGLMVGYSISQRWGVITPQVRVAYVREFEDQADEIRVDFVNSPFAGSPGQASAGAIVTADVPDKDYLILSGGVSFQLARGFSGFVEYETLEQLDSIANHQLSFGVRYQTRFK